jgi:hypothetical protein
MTAPKEYNFNVFIEENEGVFVAHALEAGMLATDHDLDAAFSKLSKMLVRHIEFAEKHGRPDQIYHPSPADVWARFAKCKDSGARPFEERNRLIAFDNRPKLRLNQRAYAACPA